MKKFLALAFVSIISFPAFTQQTKVLTAEKHNEYGLVYSLPSTALRITVTAQREKSVPGPFRQYAKRYLGTSKVVDEPRERWFITDVSVAPIGVKGEESTQYLMQLKAGATTFIGVDSNGMLLSINAEPDEPDGPEAVSSKGKMIQDGGGAEDYLQFVDMDFVSAQNSMRQAEMVANSLMDVREAYLDLTRGTADNMPSDGRQLEIMLGNLRKQESALTRAFTGSTTIEEFSTQFTYLPSEDGEEVLFRMSDFAGFVGPDDFSGAPVFIKTQVLKEGEMPVDVNGEAKKFPKDGVVYAIPGTANISISFDGDSLFDEDLEFAQFGTTFALAPSLFTDKKAPSYARFSPVTGALLEIGKAEVKGAEPKE